MDADHEDTLARLSIYTLPEPSTSFAPLLKPLLTSHTIPDTLLLILLDWSEPWNWVRQISEWIQLLQQVLSSLDEDAKSTMQEIMQEWQQRRRGVAAYDSGTGANSGNDSNVTIPLGPGEWDEALGVPLCVVCHNSDKMDSLERDRGWREEEFDYVLQFLRTILLKHGASLVYTSSSIPNALPTLVHSTLGIQSPLKRQPLKHNVIDRDKVLIPPNWDSWGKIRVLREGFDVEAISNGWSHDIELPMQSGQKDHTAANGHQQNTISRPSQRLSVAYEELISDPTKKNAVEDLTVPENGLEVETLGMQEFLANQSEIMERLKAQEEQSPDKTDKRESRPTSGSFTGGASDGNRVSNESNRVNEHIGPVQFNIGGIQVDAEDMLKRLQDREETPDRESAVPATPEGKAHNEALANFFAGLMKRGANNSPRTQGP
ncbi:hypothetical protein MMC30_004773 [Trapelia coarctata]|nr:hypothetical protein [Trapelia coarctata]